jgi:hypothetical protein
MNGVIDWEWDDEETPTSPQKVQQMCQDSVEQRGRRHFHGIREFPAFVKIRLPVFWLFQAVVILRVCFRPISTRDRAWEPQRIPGANPEIMSNNASAVKIYDATNSIARF